MASDRIGKKSAQNCPLPPHKWYWMKASELLAADICKNNIDAVGVNEPLVKSLLAHGDILNPFLCLKTWWPLCGSQRLRAIQHIRENHNPDYDPDIRVARIEDDYINYTFLWPEKEFAEKMRMVTFQMWELVFKSLWFEHSSTKDGVAMTEFEDEGDRNEGWKYVTRSKASDKQTSQQHDGQESTGHHQSQQ